MNSVKCQGILERLSEYSSELQSQAAARYTVGGSPSKFRLDALFRPEFANQIFGTGLLKLSKNLRRHSLKAPI